MNYECSGMVSEEEIRIPRLGNENRILTVREFVKYVRAFRSPTNKFKILRRQGAKSPRNSVSKSPRCYQKLSAEKLKSYKATDVLSETGLILDTVGLSPENVEINLQNIPDAEISISSKVFQ